MTRKIINRKEKKIRSTKFDILKVETSIGNIHIFCDTENESDFFSKPSTFTGQCYFTRIQISYKGGSK